MGGKSTSNYRKTLLLSQKRHIKAWKVNGSAPPFYFVPFKLGRKGKQFLLAIYYRLLKKDV
jgi:hypothetical protein